MTKYKNNKAFKASSDIICNFRIALEKAGLPTKDKIIADGKLHRFHIIDDNKSSKNGWYIIFLSDVPVGSFGNWKTGYKEKWCAQTNYDLTPAQKKKNREFIAETRRKREVEEKEKYKEARNKALNIWKISSPNFDSHPYLTKKGVLNYGLRLYKTSLVIPIHDSQGQIHSLQFIDHSFNKRFLSGGRKKGCYFAIGSPKDRICIAEGYATAASIHEVTGHPIAVAFDAGNLEAVALALRAKFPNIVITLCADNDSATTGNPGVTKAKKAAIAVGGLVAIAGGYDA